MDTRDPRLGIGGNEPPIPDRLAVTYAGRIGEVEQIAAFANSTARTVQSEDDLDKVGKLLISTRATVNALEIERKREKQPYLDAGRAVDGWFGALTDRLEKIRTVFQNAADQYQREKAAAERKAREDEARKLREAEEKKRREAEEAKRAATQEKKTDEADRLAARAEEAEEAAAAPVADLVRTRTASGTVASAASEWTFEVTSYDHVDLDLLRPYIKRDAIDAACRLAVRQGVREIRCVRIFEDVKARFTR
jgi:hypothetical protein